MTKRTIAVLACAAALRCAAGEGVMERPMCDPCVPDALRKQLPATTEAPTRGAALKAQVEAKLRASFDAAAAGGTLTRSQARAAGLGFIDRHFDAIDREGRGAVRFEDYKRFLQERGGL